MKGNNTIVVDPISASLIVVEVDQLAQIYLDEEDSKVLNVTLRGETLYWRVNIPNILLKSRNTKMH